MEIFFQDPDEVPLARPEVRIRELKATPYPDGRRVRVYLEITPFLEKPDAVLSIQNSEKEMVASVSVIETIDPKMELTIHLPPSAGEGKYTLLAAVFYRPAHEEQDETGPQPANRPAQLPERQIVDRSELSFNIPA